MTLITRSVHNPRNIPCPIRIPGYEATAPIITVAPSTTLDLLTVITEDNLIAIQDNLDELVDGGALTVTATIDTALFEQGYTGTGGVTSLSSVSDKRIIVSASTGAVTLNTPQDTDLGANPQFIGLNLIRPNNTVALSFSTSGVPAPVEILFNRDSAQIGIITFDTGNNLIIASEEAGSSLSIGTPATSISINPTQTDIFTPTGGQVAVTDNGSNVAKVGVGAGGLVTDPSAQLDLQTTTMGFLEPRMTMAQMNAIPSPATGLQVYCTDTNKLMFYNGTVWVALGSSTPTANVSQSVDTGFFQTMSNSFVTTSHTVTITPSTNTSQIRISLTAGLAVSTTGQAVATIYRNDTTNLATGSATIGFIHASLNTSEEQTASMDFIDSPATTSPVTYTVYVLSGTGGVTITYGNGSGYSNSVLIAEEVH